MGKLLRKPLNERIAPGITFVQDINQANSPLSYVGFRLIEMEKGAIYQEELTDLECCIVALTGKITVSEGDNIFAEIGTRANVFEKIPTDSVFIFWRTDVSSEGGHRKSSCSALLLSGESRFTNDTY